MGAFRWEKIGVRYVVFQGSFSVWHTRNKKHAQQVVDHSNSFGVLHIVGLGAEP